MKNFIYKKIIIIFLFIFSIICSFCSCSNDKVVVKKNELIRSNGAIIDTLVIVDDSTYAPYIFYTFDRKGKRIPAGIIVDIWNLWSQKMNIPIKYKLTTFSQAIKEVEKGKADIISSICPKYRQKEHKILYSNQYYDVKVNPIIPKHREIFFKTIAQGRYTFGVCEGDVTIDIINNEYKNIKTIHFPNYLSEIDSLIAGKISGILLEEPIFKYTLFSQNKVYKINEFAIFNDQSNTIYEPIHGASYDNKIINLINLGFRSIEKREIEDIEKKWVKKYEPNLLNEIFKDLIIWIANNLVLSFFILILLVIILSNTYAVILYLYFPYKLIYLEPTIRKLPIINIKYQSFEISISKLLFFESLIFNKRTIDSFLQKTRTDVHSKATDFLNRRKSDKYLTFPISIGQSNIGNIPLMDNQESIRNKLSEKINTYNPVGIIISGSGGIGKTTFTLQIIDWLYFDPTFYPKPFILIPIDFYSSDLYSTQEEFNIKTVAHIKGIFLSLFNISVSSSLFNYLYENKSIIILVDSFSEYVTAKKQKISNFISEWRKMGNHFIVTSRNNEYKKDFGNCIEITPQPLRTAFLINLIEHTVINSFSNSELSKSDSKRIADIFNNLNKISNDNGVTPLFCKMFTEVLYNSPNIDFSEQNPIGIFKCYELIFERYLSETINKEESIEKSKTDETVKILIQFGSFCAWKQISINQTYDLNNYLSKNDIDEFPEYEFYFKLLSSPGSIIIESSGRFKFKFDPIAEILISKYLYDKYWDALGENNIKLLNDEILSFSMNPYKEEIRKMFQNLKDYIIDQVKYLNNDQRSELILKKVNEFLININK